MKSTLETILVQKLKEVLALKDKPSRRVAFKTSLRGPKLAIIAEIKRQSPSKGRIADIADPVRLATEYVNAGAQALSILTDETFFGGHLRDLKQVASAYLPKAIPLLCKDFIIDKAQVVEAYLAGASAVLLIVAVLGEKTAEFIEFAHSLGMASLVEVANENELQLALNAGAEIIGINNRNLNTFEVDPTRALVLKKFIPADIISVVESGIRDPGMAVQYRAAGFDAVLIGEALVRSENRRLFIEACHD